VTSPGRRVLTYTGLSAEQARDWGWTVALHSEDLSGLVDYWRSVLASGKPGEIEGLWSRVFVSARWRVHQSRIRVPRSEVADLLASPECTGKDKQNEKHI